MTRDEFFKLYKKKPKETEANEDKVEKRRKIDDLLDSIRIKNEFETLKKKP